MINSRNLAAEIAIRWQSEDVSHCDRRYFDRLNAWRDYFPVDLGARLDKMDLGDKMTLQLEPGNVVPPHDPRLLQRLRRQQFRGAARPDLIITPRAGRFYPATFFETCVTFKGDYRPCRLLELDEQHMWVDLNHPLASYNLTLEAELIADLGRHAERGGRCNDIAQLLTAKGPGMQAKPPGRSIDFWSGKPFERMDPRPDADFYRADCAIEQPPDAAAQARLESLYQGFISPGMQVLDLMAGDASHLAADQGLRVTGLGLNSQALADNPQLLDSVIHDLNAEPKLPFPDATFDAVVCSFSVQYLIHPVEVFSELARVLRPGAPFIVTFTERWLPSKAIEIWPALHPFERMGLVLAYFRASGGFTRLGSESIRGLASPPAQADTLNARDFPADPLYAVWGYRTLPKVVRDEI